VKNAVLLGATHSTGERGKISGQRRETFLPSREVKQLASDVEGGKRKKKGE